MKPPIDDYDRHILAQLDKNARMSLAEIGREINLSRHAVRNRITRMEETGVIRGFRVLQGDGGLRSTRGLIFVSCIEEGSDTAIEWLVKMPGTRRVWAVSGEWDAVMVVSVAGPADLNRVKAVIDRNPLIDKSAAQMILRGL